MRWAGTLVLIAAVAVTIGWPLVVVMALSLNTSGVEAFGNSRPLELALESIKLVALTELLVLPTGITLAFLVFRTDLIGRRVILFLLTLTLFVPLPLQALAWLGSFGNQGREQALGSGPILVGALGAAFVHAVTALPWVTILVGVGLRTVEPELEESGLLDAKAWRVVAGVTFRRAAGSIAGAALATAILTSGEMTVTDLIPLRTYAEESYTLGQLGMDLGRLAARVTLPQVVVIALLVLAATRWLLRFDTTRLASSGAQVRIAPLGVLRLPITLVTWFGVVSLLVLPVYGLVWRAGRVGRGLVAGRGALWTWQGFVGSLIEAWDELNSVDLTLLGSLLLAAVGASLAVTLAWGLAWKSRTSRRWLVVCLVALALLFAAPGPVAGLAIKLAYVRVRFLDQTLALTVLGYVVRTLPFCLLVLWPVLRSIPRSFIESASIDGLSPTQQVWRVAVPLSRWSIVAAWGLAFAQSLGELPTTYVVRTSGADPIALTIWGLLHTGVESRLAGMGLILLATFAAIGGLGAVSFRLAYGHATRA